MRKRLMAVMICISALVMTGCSESKRIDTAALAETVSVDLQNGKTVYTFYFPGDCENVSCISVNADSFREAYTLAKDRYIPNLLLAKFELFAVSEKIYKTTLASDLDFMAEQYFISPQSYVALCDGGTIDALEQSHETPKQIEEHIMLLKNKNKAVRANLLSVINNMHGDDRESFCIPCIVCDGEMKAVPQKLHTSAKQIPD